MIDIDEIERIAKDGDPQVTVDIDALIAEVRRLRERLEIDPRHPYDGIACRDETIRHLEDEVRALREDVEPADEMIRAGLAVQWPALYRDGLYSEHDGAKLRAETVKRIEVMRQQYLAIRAARSKEPK